MSENSDKSHIEAWKSLIDFCKTVISVSSAILTTLIGYYIVSQPELSDSPFNYAAPFLFALAILFAIFGFGRAIKSVSSGKSQRGGIFLANLSVFALLAGILSIALINIEKDSSVDAVISKIEKESRSTNKQLLPHRVRSVSVNGGIYIVTYDTDKGTVIVTYSTSEHKVIGIK